MRLDHDTEYVLPQYPVVINMHEVQPEGAKATEPRVNFLR